MEPTDMENPAAEAPSEQESGAFEGALAPEELVVEPAAQEAENAQDARLKALLEAVVYLADEPLPPKQIATALGQDATVVERLLAELTVEYNQPHHGLTIREVAGGYQMSTKPEHHEELRNFVKSLKPAFKLSLAALETLAVIAYKQPITSPEIMEIRGVQGAGVVKTLVDRKLITAAGRKQVVGRPVLYKTTKDFLIQFGLKDLSELPTLKEFEELSRLALGEGDVDNNDAPPAEPPVDPPAEPPVDPPADPPVDPPADSPTPGEPPVQEPPPEEKPPAGEPPPPEGEPVPPVEEPPPGESNG